jgi:MoaA/NifB/PqqE/SkfB family radical SAM enzyme
VKNPFRTNKIIHNKFLNNLKQYQYSRHTGPEADICHAPTRSIYFGFNGKTVPCCFNREYIYGTYPYQSVDEIISSKLRIKLQEHLSQQDFSNGCNHCQHLISSGNLQGVEARLYDGLRSNKSGYPSEMIFELDNTCNLECIMCEGHFSTSILKNREGKKYIPGPYDSAFVKQLTPYLKKLEVAKFLGGEPFLINIHYDIWEAILRENPKCVINLQTNGTVFNTKIAKLLERGRFQIGISIDSLQKERFESIRQNAVFEDVMQNLDKFIKYSKSKGSFINLSVCPMKQNWDEIPELVNFCNNKEIYIYFNTVYTKGFDLRELPASTLSQILECYQNAQINGKSYIARRNNSFLKSLTHQIIDWYQTKQHTETYNKKRHLHSKEEFITLFKNKLPMHDTFSIEKLNSYTKDLPEIILLSDAQIDAINAMSNHEFTYGIQTETEEKINARLNNFINNCDLSLPKTNSKRV